MRPLVLQHLRQSRMFGAACAGGRRCLTSALGAPVPSNDAGVASYYDSAEHYDVLWGKDNIHIGYYPHLANRLAIPLSFQQAAAALTRRIIELGDICHRSRVLDLGCGKGLACALISELTGARCTGVDLSPGNVARAKELAACRPELDLAFHEGSFTGLSPELHGKFTHVVAQESFVHVHAELPAIFDQVKRSLAPGGRAVLNDYLGADGPVSDETKKAVYDRLGFDVLVGHQAWRRAAEDSGLELMHYENLNRHMELGYRQLSEGAAAHNFKSADGSSLEENYAKSAEAARDGQIGLNLAVYAVA